MFADVLLAARIERAEARLSADVAGTALALGLAPGVFVEEVGGGMAVYAGAGSPVNKVIGAGFAGPPDPVRLSSIEALFQTRGAPVQAEVATLADPSWHTCFGSRGYRVVGFENVLGLSLDGAGGPGTGQESAGRGPCAAGPITVVECSGPPDDETWLDVVATGFGQPDEVPAAPAGQEFPREIIEATFRGFIRAPGFRRYLALVDGVAAGGAALREWQGIAGLCGASTLPAFRRRGVQTALLVARLAAARGRGCDLAVVTTAPGSKSQQNAERNGFRLLYARALHVRHWPSGSGG